MLRGHIKLKKEDKLNQGHLYTQLNDRNQRCSSTGMNKQQLTLKGHGRQDISL